jgi:hypothetical protein
MIRLRCLCGLTLKVNEALAGRRVKCPQCHSSQLVPPAEAAHNGGPAPGGFPGAQPGEPRAAPGAVSTQPLPRATLAGNAPRPLPRPVHRLPYDSGAGAGGSPLLLVVVLGGAGLVFLLLVGGGVGAYFLFFKQTGSTPSQVTGPAPVKGEGTPNAGGAGKGGWGSKGSQDTVVPKFWVPKKVGDVRDLDFTLDMFDKFNDQVGLNNNLSSGTTAQVFKGKIKTLSVGADGREASAEVTIDVLTDTFNGQKSVVLQPGTVLIVECAGDNFVDVRYKDGGPYNDGVGGSLIRKAVNLSPPNLDPDEMGKIFPAGDKKRARDTWSGSKETHAGLVNKNRTDKLPPEAVSNSARVVAIFKEGGVTYIDLEVTLVVTFKDFRETVYKGQPADLKVNGENKQVFTYRFPADYSTGPVKSSWKNTVNLRQEGTINGQNAVAVTEIRDSWNEAAKYSGAGK